VRRDKNALLRERFELGSTEALVFSYVLILAAQLLLWGHVPRLNFLVWAGVLALTAPLPKIVQSLDVPFQRWFALELAVEGIVGVAWGLAAFLVLPDDQVRQALLCAMLIGVMVASTTSASQFMRLHLAFLIPFGGLTIAGYLLAPGGLRGAAAMLAVAFVFSVVMAHEHRAVHHNLVDLIGENDQLVDDLAEERDALESANRQLDVQAWSDALTGLANRAAFRRDLAEAIRSLSPSSHRPVTVAALDLDGFKQINDSWGHHAGDLVLIAVADALRTVVHEHEGERVFRLGGDELTVLSRTDDLDGFGRRLATAFRAPFTIEGRRLQLRAGVGIASTTESMSRDALMRDADRALYRHKRNADGVTSHQVFDEAMRTEAARTTTLEAEVTEAFESGRIRPWLQPIVDLRTGEIIGAEALARWEHDDGVRSAASFIDVMTDRGLLQQLTDRTLRDVRDFHSSLLTSGLDPLHISVNIAPAQLEQVLQDADPGDLQSLCIEITEESTVPNPARASELLTRARAEGCRVLIDDFGVGYSSLALATSLPIDGLKIDRSFVATLTTSEASLAVVSAIVDLAARLGLDVIAEGVESPAQVALLREFGVHCVQGFLFAPAVPMDQVHTWLEQRHRFTDATTAA